MIPLFRRRVAVGATVLAVAAAAATHVDAREEAGSRTVILAVEARDSAGRVVDRLPAEGLVAEAAGESLGVTPAPTGPWEVAVYVDQQLTGSRSILLMLEALADRAGELSDLGEVQLVLADEEPESVFRTDDRELLRQVLLDLSLQSGGDHLIRQLRARFLGRLDDPEADVTNLAREALEAEQELLRRRQDVLVHWLSQQGHAERPRLLLLLSDSLGVTPVEFYTEHLDEALPRTTSENDTAELAKTVASYGWTLVPVNVPADPEADEDRLSLRTNQSVGFRLRFGGGSSTDDGTGEKIEPQDLRLDHGRSEILEGLAAATGGFVVADLAELPAAVHRLASRQRLLMTVSGSIDTPQRLILSSERPDVRILAPDWIGGVPESVAEVRIRRTLEGLGEGGELPVRAKIDLSGERSAPEPAALDLDVDLSELSSDETAGTLRVSVGIHLQDGPLQFHHRTASAVPDPAGIWSWADDLQIPPGTDAAVVVVHHPASNLWGENFAEFLTDVQATAASVSPVTRSIGASAAGPALRLLPLPADLRTGRVKIRSEAREDVEEVIFLLDGERVGARRRSPFDLKVDLGTVPRQRSIIAIAYDDSGQELGRDGLVVNEAKTSFWVRITEPRPGYKVGPVDVATSLKVPEGRQLESLDFFWNDQPVETTATTPRQARVLIPVDSPAGFIRVVATLDDGSTAEDVVLMNTQRFETEINVELVELYVVVTDRLGKPVRGLESTDFLVREEEEVQEVESFSVAGDLPLTLGLAIDSSLSLFRKLPDVQDAAHHFVGGLSNDRDRAFLVGFGSEPRLMQPITGNLERLERAIGSLEPSGNTAVWEAISLSLEQLNQAAGRRALVVFYDGDDEDEQYSFRRTMELARRSLIPVYLIVMNDEAARTQGRGFAVRSRIAKLDELARTGGGRVFYVRTDEDLTPIFDEISEELRSHYLLTYYPQRPLENPEWRPIQVEVVRDGLEARTISGYGGG